ncbi:TlpA family protein disulfide reductase [Mesorhizobium sp. ANAO-SY3R2]|uniref:thiol:disulfide interchange protein TlpA n=1 Tax=Mesorhizobium sp. ANAO-SY3R2 TaxID=3166644 RepID=UPI00366AF6DC
MDRRKMFPAPRHILLAAVAGVIAGAVAVYVSNTRSGNNAPAPASVATNTGADASADDKLCAAKADRAKAVGAAATGHVAAMLPADPPRSLKSLAFNGPDGKPMTVADHSGRTLLINLWATWCAPCRAEMPALDALEREMGGENFEVVAVNVDTGDDTKPKKFLEETGVASLGFYRENTLALFNDLKKQGLALGLPVTLLIDGDGCLLANMNGPAEWASPDAKKLIEAALAQ